jgi:hypothetical protein
VYLDDDTPLDMAAIEMAKHACSRARTPQCEPYTFCKAFGPANQKRRTECPGVCDRGATCTETKKKEKKKPGEGKKHGKKNRGQGQPQQKDSQKTGKEKRLEEKAAASRTTNNRMHVMPIREYTLATGATEHAKVVFGCPSRCLMVGGAWLAITARRRG